MGEYWVNSSDKNEIFYQWRYTTYLAKHKQINQLNAQSITPIDLDSVKEKMQEQSISKGKQYVK